MPTEEMTIEGRAQEGKQGLRAPSTEPKADASPAVRSSAEARALVDATVRELVSYVESASGHTDYETFEAEVIDGIFGLGERLVALFLQRGEELTKPPKKAARARARYRRQPPKARCLGTFFGKVRYWRSYMHQTNGSGGGYFPLDDALGLTSDGFSFGVLGRSAALATKMSFAAAAETMASFLGWAPSTKTIERSVLGLGRHTGAWFEESPPPVEDGDVLVVQVDSKATPTATEEELAKRRGKRKPNPHPESARHRGRSQRRRRGPKKRRKKGDKSKNGKATTVVTMYTLSATTDELGAPKLLGPLNRWTYASYAPKRHAVAIARREADKRGFTDASGKTVQILTDGDEDLERYIKELFPEAIHTPDVIHCVEYVWKAGGCLYKEGSDELSRWVERRKNELYGGRAWDMVESMNEAADRIRSRAKRRRYDRYLDYLIKRAGRMNYAQLAERDLELSTGMVEGAVRYVVSQRFDEGGMRWIKERAEALLQLRCIKINGDWEQFVAFAHHRTLKAEGHRSPRLIQKQPEPLPTFGLAA